MRRALAGAWCDTKPLSGRSPPAARRLPSVCYLRATLGGKRLCRQARHVPRKSCLLDVHSKALSLAPQLPVGPRFRSHTPFVDDHTLRSRELWEKVMSALQNFSGGCACGAVHYETTVDPVLMLNCHCRDCQQASGSAYAPLVIFPKGGVRLHGKLRYRSSVGGSGKAVERGFCPNCGSQIAMKLESMPDVLFLQAGSLSDPSRFVPAMDVFTDGAQPWDHLPPGRKSFPRGLDA